MPNPIRMAVILSSFKEDSLQAHILRFSVEIEFRGKCNPDFGCLECQNRVPELHREAKHLERGQGVYVNSIARTNEQLSFDSVETLEDLLVGSGKLPYVGE